MSRHISSEVVHKCKWLQLEELRYADEEGKERVWEAVGRTTRQEGSKVDCVGVFTVIKKKGEEDKVLFVRQYRPPLKAYTIEFPAGLVDAGESPGQAALRELKEETGFEGRLLSETAPCSLDPGVSSAVMTLVGAEVDGDAAANQGARKVAQEGEFTEVMTARASQVMKFLEEREKAGDVVDSRITAFAAGIAFAMSMK